MDDPQQDVHLGSRALATALEPVIGSVYFGAEVHDAYAALGFGQSPGPNDGDDWAEEHWGRVMMPDGVAYFGSRGGILGRVRGEVVAAAFGVFNPDLVVPLVEMAWRIADPDALVEARTTGAVAHLQRLLGVEPEGIEVVTAALRRAAKALSPIGRPMFAGLSALRVPSEPVGQMWRYGDLLREFRGDAHVAAAAAAGFDGCQLQVLTERCAGMPPRSYAAGRGWDPDQLERAEQELARQGLLDGGDASTAGLTAREDLEQETDRLCAPMVHAIGDDLVTVVARLQEWSHTVRAADGYYPSSPQEAVLRPDLQRWMRERGLPPFASSGSNK